MHDDIDKLLNLLDDSNLIVIKNKAKIAKLINLIATHATYTITCIVSICISLYAIYQILIHTTSHGTLLKDLLSGVTAYMVSMLITVLNIILLILVVKRRPFYEMFTNRLLIKINNVTLNANVCHELKNVHLTIDNGSLIGNVNFASNNKVCNSVSMSFSTIKKCNCAYELNVQFVKSTRLAKLLHINNDNNMSLLINDELLNAVGAHEISNKIASSKYSRLVSMSVPIT